MKKACRVAIALLLAGSGLAPSEISSAATGALGHMYPPEALPAQFMDRLAAQLLQSSGGVLRIHVAPAAQVGPERELLTRLKRGDVQIALVSSTALSAEVPEYQLFRLPFLFRGYEQADAALDGQFGRALASTARKAGMIPLAVFERGFTDLASGRAVRSPADFKGLKVYTAQDPVRVATLHALGATPITLQFAEVYTALRSGVADSAEVSLQAYSRNRFYEVQRSISKTNAYYQVDVLVASARWVVDGVDPQSRRALEEVSGETARSFRRARRSEEESLVKGLAAHGIDVVSNVNAGAFEETVWSIFTLEPFAGIVEYLMSLCGGACPFPPICCKSR